MDHNPLLRIRDFGQSVWCDDIGRELIQSGRLRSLIRVDGVCGLTSNPTIFHKAITAGSAYDEQIAELVSRGLGRRDIVEKLMLSDIRLAADELRETYEATSSRDGWVSIEVSPSLAHDTQGTVSEARRIRGLISQPNIFVKVPGTEEGVQAVRDLVGLGQCINVTLIFSLERYRAVMEAYLSGLEALASRRAAGEQLPGLEEVHGAASFFVSRIDSAVDKRLEAMEQSATETGGDAERLSGLKGKAAVANAQVAYRLFQQTFSGPRWERLASQGANAQRPLWASTSTKNPDYSDTMYVESLIGPDTINTMPLATMEAYRDHGDPHETISRDVDQAQAHLDSLELIGVNLEEVASQLEDEGVRAFAESAEALLLAIEQKSV